jgi:alpha-L-rhamnosidase
MLKMLVFAGLFVVAEADLVSAAADVVTDLRCEYLCNPSGIDVVKPRLGWKLDGGGARGVRQTAYRVLVSSGSELLGQDKGDVWDSGKIESDQSVNVPYAGAQLASAGRYWWKVKVWDTNRKESDWSAPAQWDMGLLDPADWQAKWIGTEKPLERMPLLRREFKVTKPVKRAMMYISGLGYYELRLNGQKVGDYELEPGWTLYNKTCLYTTYDITAILARGANALGIILGNGFYRCMGIQGRYRKLTTVYGPLKAVAQLEIEYGDGSRENILTDESWQVAEGPITASCVFGGEDHDGALELPGWDKPGFDASAWAAAKALPAPAGKLAGLSCAASPVKRHEVFKPVSAKDVRPGVKLYDFGQNAAQRFRITVKGQRGASVKIWPSELTRTNEIWQNSIGTPTYCVYKLRGDGEETWSPTFYYCGYRYLQIECIPASSGAAEPVVESIESAVISTSAEPAGNFATSNELINRIFALIRWAQRSNMVSIMTDCPHREKLGWLEQTHLNGNALRYNYDLNVFFNKIMNDMAESQQGNGLVPNIAPEYVVFGGGFRDSPEWGSAMVQIPWQQYRFAGDVGLLERYYGNMARYVDYLGTRAKTNILAYGLGDWRQLVGTRVGVTATVIYYDDARIMAETATLLGKAEDAARYRKLAEAIRESFNERFCNQKSYSTQTGNAMALDLGLVLDENRPVVLEKLVDNLQASGLKAGEIGFPYLLRALANNGRSDVIFTMINQTNKPGYGFQLNCGATSLTEDWDFRGASQNHFMLGHIMEWFYHDLAGIQSDPSSLGFRRIVIRPTPCGGLKWVKAHYDSLYGRIAVEWSNEDMFKLKVVVPPNTTAKVYIPASNANDVTEGSRPAGEAEGVKFLRMEKNCAIYETGSGTFEFASLSSRYWKENK